MIIYWIKEPAGGLGDRIVGLVSAMFLARATRRQLEICWEWPNIDTCVDYLHTPLPEQHAQMNARDKEFKFKAMWAEDNLNDIMANPDMFTLTCNQNIGQYLWQNPHYKGVFGDYLEEHLLAYKAVFRHYLRPRMETSYPEVGIQVRVGDCAMGLTPHVAQTGEQALEMLKAAAPHCKGRSVFLTTDCAEVVDAAREVIGNFQYHEAEITHIDKDPTEAGTYKAFYDMLTLSRCDTLIFTDASNFGRVPALMGGGELLAWDGDSLRTPDLKALTSKEPVVV